jgi:ubiquinone/menaquinone biosynthesis C-methylase UbiE
MTTMSDVERKGSVMWGRVDEGKEAARLADFLNRVAAMGSAQACKQHAYAALQVAQGARVLDVGCGVGGDVRAIAELIGKTGRVVGLDFTESFIAEAQHRSVDVARSS